LLLVSTTSVLVERLLRGRLPWLLMLFLMRLMRPEEELAGELKGGAFGFGLTKVKRLLILLLLWMKGLHARRYSERRLSHI
jgi:hypothetical protein